MWLDILFLLIAGYAFYRGYSAGILRTVFTVVSIFIGLLLAMRYAGHTTRLLEDLFSSDNSLLFLLGFLLTFVLVIALIRWIAILIEKGLGAVKLNVLNKGIGGLLYATVATILLSSLLGLIDRANMLSPSTKSHSMTWPLLATVPEQAAVAYEGIKPILGDFWDESRHALERTEEN